MGAPNKHAVALEVWRAFNGSQLITAEGDKHRFMDALVARLRMTGDEESWRWGRKSRHSHTGPLSADTLGYWLGPAPAPSAPTDGQIDAVDVITSGGSVVWQSDGPDYRNIFAMWHPVDVPTSGGGNGNTGGDVAGGDGGGDSDNAEKFFELLTGALLEDAKRIADGLQAVADVGRQVVERLEDLQQNGVKLKLR